MIKACMYTRTSSATNVDGDSKERQQLAIFQYADREGIQIVAQASDDAVKGADPIGSRAGFSRILDHCITNEDVRIILVERADRFSRDQVVQELGYLELAKYKIEVIPGDAPGYFTLDPTPSQTMIRQVVGAVAQFEKDSLVLKLRGARERIRATGQKCEGRKSLSERYGKDLSQIARALKINFKSNGAVANRMAELGYTQSSGAPLHREQIRRLLNGSEKNTGGPSRG